MTVRPWTLILGRELGAGGLLERDKKEPLIVFHQRLF
jgi:hypothetical protein